VGVAEAFHACLVEVSCSHAAAELGIPAAGGLDQADIHGVGIPEEAVVEVVDHVA
jgi:hypothetical protein